MAVFGLLGLPAPEMWAQQPELKTAVVRVIGDSVGPLSFSMIGDIDVSADRLAIVDLDRCKVVFVSLEANRYVGEVGGCGRGPGELLLPVAIAWKQDSLLVAEQRRIHTFDPSGRFVRSLELTLGALTPHVLALSIADDSTAIASVFLLPFANVRHLPDPAADAFLAVIDLRTGSVRSRGLPDRDSWSRVPSAIQARGMQSCMTAAAPRSVAALSTWEFAVPVLAFSEDSLTVTGEYRRRLTGMRMHEDGPSRFSVGYASIACSEHRILAKWSDQQPRSPVGFMVLLDATGRELGTRRLSSQDTALLGVAGAARGDEYFFKTNRLFDYPVVVGVRIRP